MDDSLPMVVSLALEIALATAISLVVKNHGGDFSFMYYFKIINYHINTFDLWNYLIRC